jgi:PAS domain S-box-containing protein
MSLKSLLLDCCRRLIDNPRYHGRAVLWAVSVIAACPVILVAAFSYFRTSEELTAAELSRRQALVSLVAATLHEKLNRLTDLGVSLATRVRFRQQVEAGEWQGAVKILHDVPRDFPFIERLFISDLNGVLMADTPALPGVRGQSFAHRDWYRGVKASGKPYVSEIYRRSAAPQHHVIAVAVPIYGGDGRMAGILTLQIKSQTFSDWLNGIDTASRGAIFLVDRYGKAVAHPQRPAVDKIADYSNWAPVKKALEGKRGIEIAVGEESGEKQLVAYESLPDYGWGVVLEQSEAGALELIHDSLNRLLIAYAGVALAAFGIAYFFLRALIFAKGMNAALSESREQFRAVAETANDGIITADAQGRIVFFNQAAGRLFGHSPEEMIGRPLTAIMPQRFHRAHQWAFERYAAGGPAKIVGKTVELIGTRKDGGEFPIELSLADWRADNGRFFTAVVRDITDRKDFEAQLRSQNQLLEAQNREIQQADRLKSEFLANMSHELRTPLNAIIGFAQLMHDGKVGPIAAVHQEYLGDILSSARHLLQLVNDVLDLAKVEAGKMDFSPEPVQLSKLIGEVRQVLQTLSARKHLKVEIEVAPAVEQLVIDPAKLKQVLYNYLSNAIKFTADGGRIIVRGLPEDARSFRLEVEDNGIGVKAEDIEKLFIEFQQLEGGIAKRHQGTGLGLALTKKIVEAQGGQVGVQSVAGEGSLFYAVLPMKMEQRDDATPMPVSARRRDGTRVLVIEDDDADRRWLVETLSEAGYSVDAVGTGSEGIRKAQAERYHAVILDLILPDLGGWEVLHSIRSGGANEHVPVIVATVIAERELVKGFVVQDFLVKPVSPDALLEALRKAGIDADGGKKKILIVDDDPQALKMAKAALQAGGYEAACYASAESGLKAAAATAFSAVVLDLIMPEVDGFEFLTRFRNLSAYKEIPVVVWTSKDLTADERNRLRNSAQSIAPKDGFGIDGVLRELQRHVPSGGESGSARG